jgi:DNA-binding MarR family transcriptional regulator
MFPRISRGEWTVKQSSISKPADDPGCFEQAQFIRERLRHLMRDLDEMTAPGQRPGDSVTAQRVSAILKARRSRDRFFDRELFADPAWDMLLELYAADLAGYRLQISSLCIGAAVPATTALRWIKSLDQRGLLVRTADPKDARRFFVTLSDAARKRMDQLFRAVPEAESLL